MGFRPAALEDVAVTPGAWRGRSVLVTGHTGFKGSWLCWWLRKLGATVSGLALDPQTSPSLYQASGLAAELAPGCDMRGDIRDLEKVKKVLDARRPEVVFHMAAQSLVRESYRRPVDSFTTNLTGTVNCLEAVRHCPTVRAVVIVTTDKCYRDAGTGAACRENDELGGDDPYSASKACAELATHAYRSSFFRDPGSALVASVRAGNVIGGGDWAAERLVPDAMRAFGAGEVLEIRHPGSTRPWQHVLEPLRGYLMVAEKLLQNERAAATAWNFGPNPGDTRPVSWIADQLVRKWGAGARWSTGAPGEVHEAAELALDSTRARDALGWKPILALEEALDWVVEWYRGFSRGVDSRALTVEQIIRFQALCSG
jgi:CDP-glucose 4,6-dehydratase